MTTRRCFRRLLLCLIAASPTLVAPLEPGILPGALDQLAAESAALAQSPFLDSGEPGDCSELGDEWEPRHDLCVIEGPACPYSPYNDIRGDSKLMPPSTDFPEFCEETVYQDLDPLNNDPDDPPFEPELYAICERDDPGDDPDNPLPNLLGFAVLLSDTADWQECRALQWRICEFGTKISLDWCRAEARRSWNCGPGQIPRNEFNSCYVPSPDEISTTEVCGTSAPEFVVIDCTRYVGQDFVSTDVACGSYDTGTAPELAPAGNAYWCQFDESYLKEVCHSDERTEEECAESSAMCLKRGSGTGGCDGIAHTMLCRSEQAGYGAQAMPLLEDRNPSAAALRGLAASADAARQKGCEPCQALPFAPLPAHCPDDRTEDPVYNTLTRNHITVSLHQLIEQSHDIALTHAACGYLNTWEEVTITEACMGAYRQDATAPHRATRLNPRHTSLVWPSSTPR